MNEIRVGDEVGVWLNAVYAGSGERIEPRSGVVKTRTREPFDGTVSYTVESREEFPEHGGALVCTFSVFPAHGDVILPRLDWRADVVEDLGVLVDFTEIPS